MKGIYLVPPHGQKIWDGRKTMVVKERLFRNMVDIPLVLVSEKLAWGIIRLQNPRKIDLAQFKKLKTKHTITDEERREWWGKTRTFWAYDVKLEERFDPPRPVKVPRGVQTFIQEVVFKQIDDYSRVVVAIIKNDGKVLLLKRRNPPRKWAAPAGFPYLGEDPEKAVIREAEEETGLELSLVNKLDEYKDSENRLVIVFLLRPESGQVKLTQEHEDFRWMSEEEVMEEEVLPHRRLFLQAFRQKRVIKVTLAELSSPVIIAGLTDRELLLGHLRLHQWWGLDVRQMEDEEILNAHIFVVEEMARRGMKHQIRDSLDRKTIGMTEHKGRQVGRPIEKRLPNLDEIFERLPQEFVVLPSWASLSGTAAYPQVEREPRDLDVILRQERLTGTGDLKIHRILAKFTGRDIHLVPCPYGPVWGHIPLYDLVARKKKELEYVDVGEEEFASQFYKSIEKIKAPEIKLIEESRLIKPGKPYKPYEVAGEFYSGDEDELWAKIVSRNLDKGVRIWIEEKFDGQRLTIHRDGDRVWIFTEKGIDRAKIFPEIVGLIKGLPVSQFILDCEFIELDEEGVPLPRHEMAWIASAKERKPDAFIRVVVHDIPYLRENITEWNRGERLEAIQELLGKGLKGKLIEILPVVAKEIKDYQGYKEVLEWARTQPGSEGAMIKSDFWYKIEGANQGVWKLKDIIEIDVQIIGRYLKPGHWELKGYPEPTEPIVGKDALEWLEKLREGEKTYIYRCAVRKNNKLIPIEADSTVTPSDLEFRWVVKGKIDPATGKIATKSEWRGTESPEVWEMGLGFENRRHGETKYGNTYAIKLEPTPEIGDIITVAPVLLRVFDRKEGGKGISWTFPRVEDVKPALTRPAKIEDVLIAFGLDLAVIPELIAKQEIRGKPIADPGELTREEQRQITEAALGDWYMVRHKKGELLPFVFQYHFRGLWSKDDLKQIRTALRQARTDEELKRIWKANDCCILKTPINQLKPILQKLDDARKDITAELNKHLDKNPPQLANLSQVWTKIVNNGNVHGDWRFGSRRDLMERLKIRKKEILDFLKHSNLAGQLITDTTELVDKADDDISALRVAANLRLISELCLGRGLTDIAKQAAKLSQDIDVLFGWTVMVGKSCLQFLEDGRIEVLLRDRILENQAGDNIVCAKKAMQPLMWMRLVTEEKPVYEAPPGTVGATPETAGIFHYKDGGYYIAGCQKTDYHEYFVFFEKHKNSSGRWGIQLIAGREEYEKAPLGYWWMCNKPHKEQRPYILVHDLEKEAEKAKREKVDVIWNFEAIDTLKQIDFEPVREEEKPPEVEDITIKKFIPICKRDEEKHIVYGVVLEPDTVDGQGDIISAEEIEKACHTFMREYKKLGFLHKEFDRALYILENYIAPETFKFNGQIVKKGSWIMAVKVEDPMIWDLIKQGKITGFSVQGYAKVETT